MGAQPQDPQVRLARRQEITSTEALVAVDPATPEPLRSALEEMEAVMRSTMTSFEFAAPEMHPLLWGALHQQLTEIMTRLSQEPPA